MSSRTEEKQRRKKERPQTEREVTTRERRGRRGRLVGGGALSLLAIGAVAAAIALGGPGGESSQRGGPAADRTGDAFGPHYSGLVTRRRVAGVSTMMDTMGSTAHFHPKLIIITDGEQMTVPANIGIDPREEGMQMASLHTHDADGTIHVEGMNPATLGQFFAVWGVPLSADKLGSYRQPVRMWVDGRRSRAYGKLKLADGQSIMLAVGRGGPTR